jgi:hypothetical protein
MVARVAYPHLHHALQEISIMQDWSSDRGIAHRSRFVAPLARRGIVLATIVLTAACSDSTSASSSVRELDGPEVAVGNGTARAFVIMRGDSATSVGIALTDAALTQLPNSMAMWTLPLPSGVSALPFDHAELNWNPQGHEPLSIYGLPHFDFHFYTISLSAQMAIQGGPDTTTVPAQFVPQDYESGGVAVPMMGVHWTDSLSAEFHGHAFDKTLIYGITQGRMNFIEPMITLAYLQSHPDVSAAVKQPQAFQQPGRYPRSYRISYDASQHAAVRITLDSLLAH